MPKMGGRKKANASEFDSYVEIIFKTKIKFEDTTAITRATPELKWGDIYQMIREKNVPNVGLEEMSLYQNIKNSRITKSATHLELFPCLEVIEWILPLKKSFHNDYL